MNSKQVKVQGCVKFVYSDSNLNSPLKMVNILIATIYIIQNVYMRNSENPPTFYFFTNNTFLVSINYFQILM